ncbi:MAG: 1,4-dihydroxy-2-naphthoate octaprenyltransferase [Dysgonamonadaceae bacterium]|jgi:1,4-dihydroxy-2-naphthoate octaprenyltransferase|nr:1,4-dihydroxy-2-naphthoate octaprenyltransferase [Dysgonamonadaceae bacterium]
MIRKNSLQAWVLAVRPKTLSASATPVFVACALAYRSGYFQWKPALICLVFAVLAQIVSNLANDYFDYKKGSDKDDRLGPPRAVAEGWIAPRTMLTVTLGLLAADCALGLTLIYYGGWFLTGVGLLIAVFVLAYSGGPYPLAYHGWGDVCVLIFFGIVPVGFTYYVQALQWPLSATICGMAVGLTIINILVANNFRDRFTDREADKRTSIVIFGETFGQRFYLINGWLAVIACQYFWLENSGLAAILPLFYLPFHYRTWAEMVRIGQGKDLVAILGKTARNVLIFGVLLSLGLLLSR